MWQTIAQDNLIALFEHSLMAGTLAHAYLFVGPAHVGKATLALDLARTMNCDGEHSPCSECQSCAKIAAGKHADVVVLSMNAGRGAKEKPRVEIGIDDIRDLQHSASLPPYEGRQKVFVVDGAEHLSHEAANCLLKTLEEPPPKVTILLLSAREPEILPTIASRCQRIELKPAPRAQIEEFLTHYRGVATEKAGLLASLSQGCPGWAINASEDDAYLNLRNQRLSEMFSLLDSGWAERFAYAAQFSNDRKSAEDIISLWLVCWRDIMLTKCDCAQAVTNIDYGPIIEKWTKRLSLDQIRDFIRRLRESLDHIYSNANLLLVLESLVIDMPGKEGKRGRELTHSPISSCRT